MARVGIKQNGKNNYLQPGTFGLYEDPDEALEEDVKDLDMRKDKEGTEAIEKASW